MKLIQLQTVDSTNDYAKREIKTFLQDEVTLIVANAQTHGRGQFDRKWISPKGNLIATFVYFLSDYPKDLITLPVTMAMKMKNLLKTYGVNSSIKWPNDLYVDKKKIGGILCETVQVENKVAVIIGIGLNVNMEEEVLKTIPTDATSMQVILGRPLSLQDLLVQLQTLNLPILS